MNVYRVSYRLGSIVGAVENECVSADSPEEALNKSTLRPDIFISKEITNKLIRWSVDLIWQGSPSL